MSIIYIIAPYYLHFLNKVLSLTLSAHTGEVTVISVIYSQPAMRERVIVVSLSFCLSSVNSRISKIATFMPLRETN